MPQVTYKLKNDKNAIIKGEVYCPPGYSIPAVVRNIAYHIWGNRWHSIEFTSVNNSVHVPAKRFVNKKPYCRE